MANAELEPEDDESPPPPMSAETASAVIQRHQSRLSGALRRTMVHTDNAALVDALPQIAFTVNTLTVTTTNARVVVQSLRRASTYLTSLQLYRIGPDVVFDIADLADAVRNAESLTHVTMSHMNESFLQGIFQSGSATMQGLTISCTVADCSIFNDMRKLPSLKTLSWKPSQKLEIDPTPFLQCPGLTKLRFDQGFVGMTPMKLPQAARRFVDAKCPIGGFCKEFSDALASASQVWISEFFDAARFPSYVPSGMTFLTRYINIDFKTNHVNSSQALRQACKSLRFSPGAFVTLDHSTEAEAYWTEDTFRSIGQDRLNRLALTYAGTCDTDDKIDHLLWIVKHVRTGHLSMRFAVPSFALTTKNYWPLVLCTQTVAFQPSAHELDHRIDFRNTKQRRLLEALYAARFRPTGILYSYQDNESETFLATLTHLLLGVPCGFLECIRKSSRR